jgi:hypothetical protein
MMPTAERTLSEFLQHSGRVMPEIEEGEVVLRRREGDDLVLMTRRQSEALHTTAQIFFALAAGGPPAVEAIIPWINLLDAADRALFFRELREVGAAALQSGRLSRLAEVLYSWEATALAVWDEKRNRERLGLGDGEETPVDVPRPDR